jgi:hypothetical protein
VTIPIFGSGRARGVSDRLEFPLRFEGRIALLETGFRYDRNIREFSPEDLSWMQAYEPEALVLTLGQALSLADRKLRGRVHLPSLSVALVVLTALEDSPLAAHHRDLLWRAFGVPVFEQVRGRDGAVVARECEVHDGLHVVEPAAVRHLTGAIVRDHCECGRETPRLRPKAAVPELILTT